MVEASSFPLTAQTYPIVIGSGGAHTSSGTNSSAFGVSAIGGGRGGVAPSPRNGAPGGSGGGGGGQNFANPSGCLLYTSPSPRDKRQSRMPSSA